MKHFYRFALAALATAMLSAFSDNDYLLAEKFFLQKGDDLNVRIFNAGNAQSAGVNGEAASKIELYAGKKKKDIPVAKGAGVQNYKLDESGLALLKTATVNVTEIDREEFLKRMENEGHDEALKKLKAFHTMSVREKYSGSLKTLVVVDKPSGDVYSKVLGDKYEIVLKNNPYKLNYGDDITAILYADGKPLASAPVKLTVRSASGNAYPQELVSDQHGQVYFKLSREGIYMLSAAHSVASGGSDADFETQWASFTFAFASANELPNTYKEFGFGDVH